MANGAYSGGRFRRTGAPYEGMAVGFSSLKIHDDATARRFGFGGGLVPGVDVYGYMTHLPVLRCHADV